jgi:uncharacterized membrane protein YdjX (TVP38/TMEM64 family)
VASALAKTRLAYFTFGAILGAFVGLIAGVVSYQEFSAPVLWFMAAGAALFGILVAVFREDVLDILPWLQ